MKKLLILFCLTIFTFGYSQDKETADFNKNEIKGNALFLVAGALEITYEHILNDESGVGISLFVTYENSIDTKFSLTPYYRFYFGKKPAAGFFAEGFGMINSYEYNNNYYYNGNSNSGNKTDFALGIGIGGKWITKKGFVFEINSGVGRNLLNSNNNDYQIVGRGGITLGYRFK